MSEFQSWGCYPKVDQKGVSMSDRHQDLPKSDSAILPFGNGRSYGDSCLNADGVVVSTMALNRFIDFDTESGVLRCEAGVMLWEILDLVVPHGWFLQVTPGTKFVTAGGAIANDVHGKNHHLKGTFGCHVRQFELLRSDGQRLCCSAKENADYYAATIAGLGLTGMITWVELQLKRVTSPAIAMENIKYQNLDEFFSLSEESDQDWEYTMAWVDCVASGSNIGRGHFMRGNHADASVSLPPAPKLTLQVPFTPPISLINSYSLKAFNWAYYERQQDRVKSAVSHYEPFLYPLDSILDWNRIYGPKGFLQYQCAIPYDNGLAAMKDILRLIAQAGFGSFLAVLKVFGDKHSPGLMSFPMRGVTLALDFPYVESKTLPFFKQLDDVVVQTQGRIYPAKDAHMSAELFQAFYPQWRELEALRDPKINSSMWQRVTQEI